MATNDSAPSHNAAIPSKVLKGTSKPRVTLGISEKRSAMTSNPRLLPHFVATALPILSTLPFRSDFITELTSGLYAVPDGELIVWTKDAVWKTSFRKLYDEVLRSPEMMASLERAYGRTCRSWPDVKEDMLQACVRHHRSSKPLPNAAVTTVMECAKIIVMGTHVPGALPQKDFKLGVVADAELKRKYSATVSMLLTAVTELQQNPYGHFGRLLVPISGIDVAQPARLKRKQAHSGDEESDSAGETKTSPKRSKSNLTRRGGRAARRPAKRNQAANASGLEHAEDLHEHPKVVLRDGERPDTVETVFEEGQESGSLFVAPAHSPAISSPGRTLNDPFIDQLMKDAAASRSYQPPMGTGVPDPIFPTINGPSYGLPSSSGGPLDHSIEPKGMKNTGDGANVTVSDRMDDPDSASFVPPGKRQRAIRSGPEGVIAKLKTRLVEARAEAAGFEADAIILEHEKDAALTDRDHLAVEKDAVITENDAITTERDGIAAERDRLAIENAELQAKIKGMQNWFRGGAEDFGLAVDMVAKSQ